MNWDGLMPKDQNDERSDATKDYLSYCRWINKKYYAHNKEKSRCKKKQHHQTKI